MSLLDVKNLAGLSLPAGRAGEPIGGGQGCYICDSRWIAVKRSSLGGGRGVSFTVDRGLVGESGSGKSVTALSTVSLLGDSAIVEGSVHI